MIVARIEGGLGNQLFQVAFGMQLARRHQSELVLDLSSYADKPAHGYLLDRFDVPARELRRDEMRRLPRRYRSADAEKTSWFALDRLQRVREKPFGFAEKYLHAPDDSYLVGYWQSERFFGDVADLVREHFRVRGPVSAETERLRERMLTTASLALHVRRGDYVTNPQAAAIYRNLSLEYYRQSVLARLAERNSVEVYVFSNDIAWCREHLALPCPVHFVEHTTSASAHEDLSLMSAAESIVIANSTFSWWGAWLGQRAERHVVAPRRWFHPGTLDDRHLACAGWHLVDDPAVQLAAA
ncbi:MAG: alpha-1,2-fucosyltransferase [Aureliella sp.]